jgi:hypothetical protein
LDDCQQEVQIGGVSLEQVLVCLNFYLNRPGLAIFQMSTSIAVPIDIVSATYSIFNISIIKTACHCTYAVPRHASSLPFKQQIEITLSAAECLD